MITIEFDDKSLQRFLKRIQRAERWGQIDRKEIKKANRAVGNIYKKALRTSITDGDRDSIVRGKTYPSGKLRRSIGNWSPKGDRRGTIMTGPKASSIRRVSPSNDGFHAAWVEAGIAGNNTTSKSNKGVFARTLSGVKQQMQAKQYAEYKKRFEKYMR